MFHFCDIIPYNHGLKNSYKESIQGIGRKIWFIIKSTIRAALKIKKRNENVNPFVQNFILPETLDIVLILN